MRALSPRPRRAVDLVARLALAYLAGLAIVAALAPLWPLEDPAAVKLPRALAPPGSAPAAAVLAEPIPRTGLAALRRRLFGDWSIGPCLGTDDLGRCLLSRLVFGARVSLTVAALASLLSLVLGTTLGLLAGWRGGAFDRWTMRVVDVISALPMVFLVIFVVSLLRGVRNARPDMDIDQISVLLFVIALTSWLSVARLVRAEVASLKQRAFIDAAVLSGLSERAIFLRHLLPNLLPIVIVALTLNVPRIFLFEAFLSFLGLGVEAPSVSWGLLARQGYDSLTAVHATWWMVVFPAAAFLLTLLAMNFLGDRWSERLDPRQSSEPVA